MEALVLSEDFTEVVADIGGASNATRSSADDADVPALLRDLDVMQAPRSLRDDATQLVLSRDAASTERGRRLARAAQDFLLERAGEGDIVSLRRVFRRVPVMAAAAPDVPEAEVSASFDVSAGGEVGLKISLWAVGLDASVTYTIKQSLKVECTAGQARLGYLLLPVDEETRMHRPPGGRELFPVKRYIPARDAKPGGMASAAAVDELLEGGSEQAPLVGDDATLVGGESRSLEVAFSLELGGKWADDALALSLTGKVTGTVEVAGEWSLPAGSYAQHWTLRPAGCCIIRV